MTENTQRGKGLLWDLPGLEELSFLEVVKPLQDLDDSIDTDDLAEDLNIEADRRLARHAGPLHECQDLAGCGVSPAACSTPAASDPDYTLFCDEPQ
jgi:hypothetical protein